LLLEFLRWGEKDLDEIILAGDIFDLVKDKMTYIRRDNPRLVKKVRELMDKGKLTYIYGNHDEDMKYLWGLKQRYIIPETDVVVLHGHQFDWVIKPPIRRLGEAAVRFAAIIEDLGWKSFSWNMSTLAYVVGARKLPDPTKECDRDIYYNESQEIIRSISGVNRLVHGHTHRAHKGDGIVMNCGCSTWGFSDYLYIEGDYSELKKMKEGFP